MLQKFIYGDLVEWWQISQYLQCFQPENTLSYCSVFVPGLPCRSATTQLATCETSCLTKQQQVEEHDHLHVGGWHTTSLPDLLYDGNELLMHSFSTTITFGSLR